MGQPATTQRRNGHAVWRFQQAGAISGDDEMESGLVQCAAHLRDRPDPGGGVRHLVCQQRQPLSTPRCRSGRAGRLRENAPRVPRTTTAYRPTSRTPPSSPSSGSAPSTSSWSTRRSRDGVRCDHSGPEAQRRDQAPAACLPGGPERSAALVAGRRHAAPRR